MKNDTEPASINCWMVEVDERLKKVLVYAYPLFGKLAIKIRKNRREKNKQNKKE